MRAFQTTTPIRGGVNAADAREYIRKGKPVLFSPLHGSSPVSMRLQYFFLFRLAVLCERPPVVFRIPSGMAAAVPF